MIQRFITTTTLVLSLSASYAQNDNFPKVREIKLSNGMTVWLSEEHSQPIVNGAVVVKAGAKDSPNTGIAHYFEHIMFKGTEKLGTIDYPSEKLYMDSIVCQYDALVKTTDKNEENQIQKEINRLSIEQSKYVVPNEFDHIITRFGGSGLNAYTSYDITAYFNTFTPDYMEQWTEINSERLLKPVFRLFQSELETVYEEKNMYADNMMTSPLEKVLERFYEDNPYQYPIIGSSENLKKPNLREMEEFFRKYYVGNNMGLILCGDFDSDKVIPLLERTFGRIPAGEVKDETPEPLKKLNGREAMKVKVPIPVVKAFVKLYRGPEAGSDDKEALEIICSMLNNDNGTGYLDKLMVDNKLMMSQAMFTDMMKDGSIIMIAALPKLMFQSKGKAEKLVNKEVDRIKKGDFSDSLFTSVKQELRRGILMGYESSEDRLSLLIDNFTNGVSWDKYQSKLARLESLTKEDIVVCANKYLNDDYLYVSKKYGNYPKDKIEKPDIRPIPQSSESDIRSAYYDSLDRTDTTKMKIRLVDFNNDFSTVKLAEKCDLYYKNLNANNIFECSFIYRIGTDAEPLLSVTDQYLYLIGTDSLSHSEFRKSLQLLGAVMDFDSKDNYFKITVKGFDENYAGTMELVKHFMSSAKGDKKMYKQIKSAIKISDKSFLQSGDDVANAIAEKIRKGDKSSYLNRVTSGEISKLKDNSLTDLFNEIQKYECDIHYSGTLPQNQVEKVILATVNPESFTKENRAFELTDFQTYDKPVIYFFNNPKSRQSIIKGYLTTPEKVSVEEREKLRLLNYYFGTDMTSVMFQQIREFRSLAYRANSRLKMEAPKHKDQIAAIETHLSTQSDKTIEALTLLDSLISNMPLNESSYNSTKRSICNFANNMYPEARTLTSDVSTDKTAGYSKPWQAELCGANDLEISEFEAFYSKIMKDSQRVYIIVGNKKDIDMDKLGEFAEIKYIDSKSFYKK